MAAMNKLRIIPFFIIFSSLLCIKPYLALGHDTSPRVDWQDIIVNEKPGKKVPGDILFLDEYGKTITLGGYIDKPTLILPLYYYCKQSCAIMLGNLAAALNEVPLAPGKDYRVITLSIDQEDDPAAALQSKKNYLKVLKKEFPETEWKFLTGSKANISRATDSFGYHYKQVGWHNFVHPNVMVVVSRDGTIIRYLYGPLFLPFDIGMALTEASKGIPSISIRKLLSYCFSYEPEKKSYAFNTVRVLVLGIVAMIGVIMFFLLRKKES
jgi:protein SCO1